MLILETNRANIRRNTGIAAAIAFALTASFGLLLTMHIYVKPSAPSATGWRVFGFPRAKK